TISWTSTNSDYCDAGTGNGTGITGSFSTGALTSSKSYSVTCTGTYGTDSGSTRVLTKKSSGGTSSQTSSSSTKTASGGSSNSGSSGSGGSSNSGSSGSGGGNSSLISNNKTSSLSLGQTATPPSNAIVRYHEGVETVFTRQILADLDFAKLYGYQDGMSLQTFTEDLSHLFAKTFGYIDASGKEIRVVPPDRAAYQLQLVNNKLTVYEYFDNKIVDIRNTDTSFKDALDYEYYYKK
ncbi:MAG: hypothetical protein WCX46_04650, partial [Candidatus Paceibacterota bacterium]